MHRAQHPQSQVRAACMRCVMEAHYCSRVWAAHARALAANSHASSAFVAASSWATRMISCTSPRGQYLASQVYRVFTVQTSDQSLFSSQKKGTAQGSRLSIAATATPHPPLIPLVTPPHKRSLLCTPAPLPSKSPAQPPRPKACNNHRVAPEAFYLGVLVSHPLVVVRNVLRGAVPVPVAKKEKREQQRLVRKSQDSRPSAAHPTFFGASPL